MNQIKGASLLELAEAVRLYMRALNSRKMANWTDRYVAARENLERAWKNYRAALRARP